MGGLEHTWGYPDIKKVVRGVRLNACLVSDLVALRRPKLESNWNTIHLRSVGPEYVSISPAPISKKRAAAQL
jgi:hypothetical protein